MTGNVTEMLDRATALGIDAQGCGEEGARPGFVFYMLACEVVREAHELDHPDAGCAHCAEIGHALNALCTIAGLDEEPEEWPEILRDSQAWWPEPNWPDDEWDYSKHGEGGPEAAEDANCGVEMNHVCKTAQLLELVIFPPEEADGFDLNTGEHVTDCEEIWKR